MADARVHITGASCTGVTTLGQALAERLGLRHLDVDDFYWMPTDPPFTTKRPAEDRVALILREMSGGPWVLAGSLMDWGDALVEDAGLIVFVDTPTPVRLARLLTRERERYGTRIDPGGDMFEGHRAFLDWASRYDDPAFAGRSRARHEAWLSARGSRVLRLEGTRPVGGLVEAVVGALGDAGPSGR